MSYQFIHIEDYSINLAKKKANKEKDFNNETKGRNLREIIAEAKREIGNCSHVENPQDPILLYGVDLDQVEELAINYFNNTKIKDKNGKEKKLRSDSNVILSGVISLSSDNSEFWEEYKKSSVEYLREKYGEKLKCIVEHTDEANPHIHFYCIQNTGEKFDLIHDGKKASYENKDKVKGLQNKAYIEAMRSLQNDFFIKVSSNYGLTKEGPKRARMSRSDYMKHKREVELLNLLKQKTKTEIDFLLKETDREVVSVRANASALGQRTGRIEGYKKAISDFQGRNYFNKVIFSKTFNNDIIKKISDDNLKLKDKAKKLFIRKEHYKKENEINNEYKIKYEEEKKKNDYLNIINDFIDKPKQEEILNYDIRARIIREITAIESQQQQLNKGSEFIRSRDERNRAEVKRNNQKHGRIGKMLFYSFRDLFRDFFSVELFKRMFKAEETNTIKKENYNQKEEVKIKQNRYTDRNTKSRRI